MSVKQLRRDDHARPGVRRLFRRDSVLKHEWVTDDHLRLFVAEFANAGLFTYIDVLDTLWAGSVFLKTMGFLTTIVGTCDDTVPRTAVPRSDRTTPTVQPLLTDTPSVVAYQSFCVEDTLDFRSKRARLHCYVSDG